MTQRFSHALNNKRQMELDRSTNRKSQIDRKRDRLRRFAKGLPDLAATIVIAMFLTASAIAQERQHAYREYTYWFDGAFENGHAFSSTVGARNYQLEIRYERLIYWNQPFAVRWVLDTVPAALVGDPHSNNGHRAYAYGVGGSPIGAQLNFVHYRHVEPFLTSGGGFLYFNHRMFALSSSTLLLNLVVGCSCSHPVGAPPLILDTSITTFRMRIWQIKIPDWTRICCSSGCRCFGEQPRSCPCLMWSSSVTAILSLRSDEQAAANKCFQCRGFLASAEGYIPCHLREWNSGMRGCRSTFNDSSSFCVMRV